MRNRYAASHCVSWLMRKPRARSGARSGAGARSRSWCHHPPGPSMTWRARPRWSPKARTQATAPVHRVIGSQEPPCEICSGLAIRLSSAAVPTRVCSPDSVISCAGTSTSRGIAGSLPITIHTAGWVQILGVDTALATATVLHACDGILLDDYLEPFTPPMIAARSLPGTTPHYENMGHVMTGSEGLHTAGGSSQLMTIDRGSNAGVVVGQRFLVFRNKRDERVETIGRSKAFEAMGGRLPLVEIGEVLVVGVRADDATVQILGAKDAIATGDLIAPIK